jgi:hypothetical protein
MIPPSASARRRRDRDGDALGVRERLERTFRLAVVTYALSIA